MLEIAEELRGWLRAGIPVALATAIDVLGGSPHPPGSTLAVAADGRIVGAVSGGCVESAAHRACTELLAGAPPAVQRYGFGDDPAPGASCGGEVDVLVHALTPAALPALDAAAEGAAAAIAVALTGGPEELGAVTGPVDPATALLGTTLLGGRRVLIDVRAAAPRLIVCGATAVAAALATMARAAGYRVTVVDPRAALTRPDRFPGAHRVVVGRPHELLAGLRLGRDDAVCVLGHDEDLDPLAIAAALDGAGYVGALGSRPTAARRAAVLAALGVPPAGIARLRSPIGLDLGVSTPAGVAVAVLAEMLAVRAGAAAQPLRDGTGPIRRQRAQATDLAAAASSCSGATSTSAALRGSVPNTQTVPIR